MYLHDPYRDPALRILLANTPLQSGPQLPIPRVAVDKGTGDMPLGLLYLAASLQGGGFPNVSVLDVLTLGLTPEQAAERVARDRPDLLGLTVYSFSCADLSALCERVRNDLPACHICLGGPHASRYPVELLEGGWADSVCVGYGEGAIVALAGRLEQGRDPEGIPGMGWRDEDRVFRLRPSAPMGDIDAIPFPDRGLADRSLYSTWAVDRPLSATGVLTSRGCPFGCVFCSQSRTPFAQRSVDNVLREVEQCRDQGYQMIYFQDDTMNLNPGWMHTFAQSMAEMEDRPAWCFRGRVTGFDEKLAHACAQGGCVRVNLGIEAGSTAAQKQIGKGIDLEEALTAVRAARQAGIATVCYFIMGFPGETREQIRETYSFARRLDPDYAIFSPLYLLPGTALYERERRIRGDGYDPYAAYTRRPSRGFVPPPPSGTVDRKTVFRAVRMAYVKFYFSPRYLLSGRGTGGGVLKGFRAGLSILSYFFFGLRDWN